MNLPTTLLLLSTLLPLSSPFRIPKDTTPGSYAVTISPSGQEIHTPLSTSSTPNPANRTSSNPHHQKRAATQTYPPQAKTYCGDSYIEASDFTDKASLDFQARCNRTNGEFLTTSAMAVYSLHGTAVAYMCNFSGGGNPCVAGEFLDVVRRVRETCLWSRGGVLQTG